MNDQRSSSPGTFFREFTDSRGTHWRVWKVTPSQSARSDLTTPAEGIAAGSVRAERLTREEARRAEWTKGWLLFESAHAKKRLLPIPEGWATASIESLERFCDDAKPVKG